VAALAARDAEHVLRFVAAAEELDGDEPFTPDQARRRSSGAQGLTA
jgi:hypothetical protein